VQGETQNSREGEPEPTVAGEARDGGAEAQVRTAGPGAEDTGALMEEVLTRENLVRALERVVSNAGAAGVDGLTVEELKPYLQAHWPGIKAQLLAGSYQPQPVRRVMIPKAGGGERMLGIPGVVDRLIQQALLQVLQARWDASFSESSYGFRPGRSAHQALRAAQAHVESGRRIVVDVDLEKFFDRVNHDILMDRVAKRVADVRVRKLIRAYLNAGLMADGVVIERREGTPQGGPLSPLLANLLLDEVDRELERRGHRFVRYADDCNIYVSSARAGERVMQQITRLLERLKLKVNAAKSAVAPVEERQFLGYRLVPGATGTQVVVAPKARERFREEVRRRTRRTAGRSVASVIEELTVYLRGWAGYFRLAGDADTWRALAGWVGRRVRALVLKHWRTPGHAYRHARRLGASDHMARAAAYHRRRRWFTSGTILNAVIRRQHLRAWGLYDLAQHAQ
jgi:group II intron reverse transcriptase/maturase